MRIGMGAGLGAGMGGPPHGAGNRPKASLKEVKLSRILRLFAPYRWHMFLILWLALAAAVIGLGPPLVMKEIIDRAIPEHDRRLLVYLIVLLVALPLFSGLVGVWQNHLNNKVGQGVMRDLRHSLFANLQRQSVSFFTDARSGEVVQRLTGDVQAVQGVVTGTVVSAVSESIVLITTLIILLGLDWKLTLISMVILPLFVMPVRRVSGARKRLRSETQKVRGEMASELGEMFGVSGAMLTRIFGREELQERLFSALNEEVMRLELKLNLIGRWYMMAVGVLAPAGTAIIYLYGGFGVMNQSMTIGGIVAFAAYVTRLYGPVTRLLNLHVEVATALGVFQRLFEYLDLTPSVADAPDAHSLGDIRGSVEYRHVTYAYREGSNAVSDVSFRAEPGELVALAGPSGAGKSTLIGMLARLYDPTEGSVRVDGHDLRNVTLRSLRSQIAFVTQDPFLFHATVRENLLFAKSDATEEQLEEACRKAYIWDLIAKLPEGLDTVVGERGHRLSGGERQRLAIARAILRNPRILILDEATSHLDSESEAYVQSALEELMQGRTTLVIAHRLSTVLAADRILVLEEGRIVEKGTHDELLVADGLYARLFKTPFSRSRCTGEITKPAVGRL